jgi:hypothetical protein
MRVSIISTFIKYSASIHSQSNKERERNKRGTNKIERSQIIIICKWYDPIFNRPKDSTKKLLYLINTFNKVAG